MTFPKAILTFLTSAVLSLSLFAQDEQKMEYLIDLEKGIRVNGFGGPIVGFSAYDDDFAVYVGGGGAVLLNQVFFIGGYGMGLATEHPYKTLEYLTSEGDEICRRDLNIQFGHGGFWLGYIHKPMNAIHFSVSSKFGFGEISLHREGLETDFDEGIGVDRVFVLTPQAEMELNILKWFRIVFGAGYQFVTGIDKRYTNLEGEKTSFYDEEHFNKPEFTISLMFGGFGSK